MRVRPGGWTAGRQESGTFTAVVVVVVVVVVVLLEGGMATMMTGAVPWAHHPCAVPVQILRSRDPDAGTCLWTLCARSHSWSESARMRLRWCRDGERGPGLANRAAGAVQQAKRREMSKRNRSGTRCPGALEGSSYRVWARDGNNGPKWEVFAQDAVVHVWWCGWMGLDGVGWGCGKTDSTRQGQAGPGSTPQ
jgi:hypothetical protein